MKRIGMIAALCAGMWCWGGSAGAQAPATVKKETPKLDATGRREAIDGTLTLLKRQYVFPEVAVKMESAIRERATKGEYDPHW